MRNITEKASNAFKNQKNFKLSNTEVVNYSGEDYTSTKLYLHGHAIADLWTRKDGKKNLYITNCGYETNVTKERLNGILNEFGLGGIYQKNFTRYLETKDGVEKFPTGKNNAYGFIL